MGNRSSYEAINISDDINVLRAYAQPLRIIPRTVALRKTYPNESSIFAGVDTFLLWLDQLILAGEKTQRSTVPALSLYLSDSDTITLLGSGMRLGTCTYTVEIRIRPNNRGVEQAKMPYLVEIELFSDSNRRESWGVAYMGIVEA